jgi:hypothetical protein
MWNVRLLRKQRRRTRGTSCDKRKADGEQVRDLGSDEVHTVGESLVEVGGTGMSGSQHQGCFREVSVR